MTEAYIQTIDDVQAAVPAVHCIESLTSAVPETRKRSLVLPDERCEEISMTSYLIYSLNKITGRVSFAQFSNSIGIAEELKTLGMERPPSSDE